MRDVNYLRGSATDRDDRFKLFSSHLPRPALCCFDDFPSESFEDFILGQDPMIAAIRGFTLRSAGA